MIIQLRCHAVIAATQSLRDSGNCAVAGPNHPYLNALKSRKRTHIYRDSTEWESNLTSEAAWTDI